MNKKDHCTKELERMNWYCGKQQLVMGEILCHVGVGMFLMSLLCSCASEKQISVVDDVSQAPNVPAVQSERSAEKRSLAYTSRQLARRETPGLEAFTTPELQVIPQEAHGSLEIRRYFTDITSLENKLEVRVDFFNANQGKKIQFEVRTLFFREDNSLADFTDWIAQEAAPRQFARYSSITASPVASKELVQIRNVTLANVSTN